MVSIAKSHRRVTSRPGVKALSQELLDKMPRFTTHDEALQVEIRARLGKLQQDCLTPAQSAKLRELTDWRNGRTADHSDACTIYETTKDMEARAHALDEAWDAFHAARSATRSILTFLDRVETLIAEAVA